MRLADLARSPGRGVGPVHRNTTIRKVRCIVSDFARGTALTGGVAGRAAGRGSGDGIDRTVLETRLGNPGAVLETDLPDAERALT